MVLGLDILWTDTAGSSEILATHWPMGCTGEMADGANKEWPALGIWRLWVYAWQEGLEHVLTSGLTSSFKVERLALNLCFSSSSFSLVLGLQAYITTSYPGLLAGVGGHLM